MEQNKIRKRKRSKSLKTFKKREVLLRIHLSIFDLFEKTDLRAYFKCRATGFDGPTAKKKNRNPEIIAPGTEHAHLFL